MRRKKDSQFFCCEITGETFWDTFSTTVEEYLEIMKKSVEERTLFDSMDETELDGEENSYCGTESECDFEMEGRTSQQLLMEDMLVVCLAGVKKKEMYKVGDLCHMIQEKNPW